MIIGVWYMGGVVSAKEEETVVGAGMQGRIHRTGRESMADGVRGEGDSFHERESAFSGGTLL